MPTIKQIALQVVIAILCALGVHFAVRPFEKELERREALAGDFRNHGFDYRNAAEDAWIEATQRPAPGGAKSLPQQLFEGPAWTALQRSLDLAQRECGAFEGMGAALKKLTCANSKLFCLYDAVEELGYTPSPQQEIRVDAKCAKRLADTCPHESWEPRKSADEALDDQFGRCLRDFDRALRVATHTIERCAGLPSRPAGL